MGGKYSDFERREGDRYFTPGDFAISILDMPGLPCSGRIFDPSAGAGATMDPFINAGYDVTGIDIEPLRNDIIEADFLGLDRLPGDLPYDAIVTNPPWDQTPQFLRCAFEIAPTVPVFFLLKSDWLHVQGHAEFWPHVVADGRCTGRPRWMEGTDKNAKETVSWFHFGSETRSKPARSYGLPIGKALRKYTGKRCLTCNGGMAPRLRADAKFCGDLCRNRHFRAQQQGATV
jgi:hypothetical protein